MYHQDTFWWKSFVFCCKFLRVCVGRFPPKMERTCVLESDLLYKIQTGFPEDLVQTLPKKKKSNKRRSRSISLFYCFDLAPLPLFCACAFNYLCHFIAFLCSNSQNILLVENVFSVVALFWINRIVTLHIIVLVSYQEDSTWPQPLHNDVSRLLWTAYTNNVHAMVDSLSCERHAV